MSSEEVMHLGQIYVIFILVAFVFFIAVLNAAKRLTIIKKNVEVSVGKNINIRVNGKKVDPKSKEGKMILKEIDSVVGEFEGIVKKISKVFKHF